jgi:hypothetical protein
MFIMTLLCTGIFACSDVNNKATKPSPMQQFRALATAEQHNWLKAVCKIFDASSDRDSAQEFSQRISAVFAFAVNEEHTDSLGEQGKCSISLDANVDNNIQPAAAIERKLIQQRMMKAFLLAYLGENSEIVSAAELEALNQALSSLILRYPLFKQSNAWLYENNNSHFVFAFEKQGDDNVRAYVAFNLSFDAQKMPFPLGFMSSTKVTVWRSGEDTLNTFVTNQAIALPALSAAIVLVGI